MGRRKLVVTRQAAVRRLRGVTEGSHRELGLRSVPRCVERRAPRSITGKCDEYLVNIVHGATLGLYASEQGGSKRGQVPRAKPTPLYNPLVCVCDLARLRAA